MNTVKNDKRKNIDHLTKLSVTGSRIHRFRFGGLGFTSSFSALRVCALPSKVGPRRDVETDGLRTDADKSHVPWQRPRVPVNLVDQINPKSGVIHPVLR